VRKEVNEKFIDDNTKKKEMPERANEEKYVFGGKRRTVRPTSACGAGKKGSSRQTYKSLGLRRGGGEGLDQDNWGTGEKKKTGHARGKNFPRKKGKVACGTQRTFRTDQGKKLCISKGGSFKQKKKTPTLLAEKGAEKATVRFRSNTQTETKEKRQRKKLFS